MMEEKPPFGFKALKYNQSYEDPPFGFMKRDYSNPYIHQLKNELEKLQNLIIKWDTAMKAVSDDKEGSWEMREQAEKALYDMAYDLKQKKGIKTNENEDGVCQQ